MTNYIKEMRELIGHRMLLTVGCGALIIKDDQILLQHRKDKNCWGIPGGTLEMGESFTDSTIREIYEETGLKINRLRLFGIYSGEDCFAQYPNGDKVFSPNIVFIADDFSGEICGENEEAYKHRFFSKNDLPDKLNPIDVRWIRDWANDVQGVIVK